MIVQFGIHYAVYVASMFITPTPAPAPVLPPSVVVSVPTTTTTLLPRSLTVLERAQASIGVSRTEYGFTDFWCAEFVEMILANPAYDTALDSPAQLKLLVPPVSDPLPGDLVFVSFQPVNGETHHVVFVESTNPDGSVNTIEGNGPDANYVVRGIRTLAEITGFGRP